MNSTTSQRSRLSTDSLCITSEDAFSQRLPFEILTKIFDTHLGWLPSRSRNRSLFNLMNVCKLWLTVIVGDPHFWSSIFISLWHTPVECARLMITRSGPHILLSIRCEFTSLLFHSPLIRRASVVESDAKELCKLLQSQYYRIQYLDITDGMHDSDLLKLLFQSGTTPLETLIIGTRHYAPRPPFRFADPDASQKSAVMPLLRNLELRELTLDLHLTTFGQITHLILHELSNARLWQLVIRQCKRLVVGMFCFDNRQGMDEADVVVPCTLLYLQYLSLKVTSESGIQLTILNKLTLPALISLKLCVSKRGKIVIEDDLQLNDQLGELRKLALIGPTPCISKDSFKRLISFTPNLTHLEVEMDFSLDDIFSTLLEESPSLPNLHTLEIDAVSALQLTHRYGYSELIHPDLISLIQNCTQPHRGWLPLQEIIIHCPDVQGHRDNQARMVQALSKAARPDSFPVVLKLHSWHPDYNGWLQRIRAEIPTLNLLYADVGRMDSGR